MTGDKGTVADNPDGEQLTLRAMEKHNLRNEVKVRRDGIETLDHLLATGATAGRTFVEFTRCLGPVVTTL
jgi:hypothetical protein